MKTYFTEKEQIFATKLNEKQFKKENLVKDENTTTIETEKKSVLSKRNEQ